MGLFSNKNSAKADGANRATQPVAPHEAPTPVFDDPEDAMRWELFNRMMSLLEVVHDKYQECVKKADYSLFCYNSSEAETVDGVILSEIARKGLHDVAVDTEGELQVLLVELQATQAAALEHWKNLLFLIPAGDNEFARISDWCGSRGLNFNPILTIFIYANYGATLQTFLTEYNRVNAMLEQIENISKQSS